MFVYILLTYKSTPFTPQIVVRAATKATLPHSTNRRLKRKPYTLTPTKPAEAQTEQPTL